MARARKRPRWIEYHRLDEIVRAPRNPKLHVDLGPSMERFDFTEPGMVCDRRGMLVAGHGRLEKLLELEAAGAPVPQGITVDDEGRWQMPIVHGWSSADDDEFEAYLIASNQLAAAGGVDLEAMVEVLSDLARGPGLAGTGVADKDLEAMVRKLTARRRRDEQSKLGMPDPGQVVSGQVWDVGPHRLVVGDARNEDLWTALPLAAAVVMDPPYGIGYEGGPEQGRVAIDGDATPDEAAELLGLVLDRLVDHVLDGAPSFTFLPGGPAFVPLLAELDRRGLHRWMLVWAKNRATLARGDFQPQHEEVNFGWFDLEVDAEHISYSWFGGPRRHPVSDRRATTLLRFDRPSVSADHPTAKPVDMLEHLVGLVTEPGEVVLDPFAGSGSTLVAAARLGRVGAGIELRPEYGHVILGRLAEVTGVDPVLVAGKESG